MKAPHAGRSRAAEGLYAPSAFASDALLFGEPFFFCVRDTLCTFSVRGPAVGEAAAEAGLSMKEFTSGRVHSRRRPCRTTARASSPATRSWRERPKAKGKALSARLIRLFSRAF
jgi:hypothetical protein